MKHKIKELYGPPSTRAATLILLRYTLLLVVTLSMVAWFSNWVLTIALAFFVAVYFKGFNNIVHECSHNSFSNSRTYNMRVGHTLCAVLFMDFVSYKVEHTSHHRHLGNYENDIDFKERRRLGHDRAFTARRVFKHIVSLTFMRLYWPAVDLSVHTHRVSLALYAVLFSGLYLAHAYSVITALLIAHLIFLPLTRYLTDIIDHGGLYREDVGEIYKSRNFIIQNPVLRGIFFPRNDCYHLIHHLYPYLPVHNFDLAHIQLMSDPTYSILTHHGSLSVLSMRR